MDVFKYPRKGGKERSIFIPQLGGGGEGRKKKNCCRPYNSRRKRKERKVEKGGGCISCPGREGRGHEEKGGRK